MLICGIEFDFSALNADDVERMEAAQKHMSEADAAEQQRYKAENVSYTGVLRSQSRLIMSFLDEVLGAGASERLGLTGGDLGAAQTVCESFRQAITTEKARFAPQPQNRAQRRAVAHEKTRPLILPAVRNTAVPLAAPAESDIPAAVEQALPRVMQFLRTPAGAKVLAEAMTSYQGAADNG